MSKLRRGLLGLLVAGALLGGVEAAARLLSGPPPAAEGMVRISAMAVDDRGDALHLSNRANPGQDVVLPKARQGRPRVAVLGGSSVRQASGSPPDVDFPLHLDARLPDVDVVNLGAPGTDSDALVGILESLSPVALDLVVLYTGHNDFGQMVFTGTVRGGSTWTSPVRAALSHSWIFHLLGGAPRVLLPADQRGRGGLVPTPDDTGRRRQAEVLAQLEENLRRAVAAAPAPVLLVTQVRSAEHPPVGLLTPPDGAACAAAGAEVGRLPPSDPAALADRIEAACGPDRAAEHWLRSLVASHPAEARAHFAESLRRDPLPLRAPFEADEVVRRVGATTGTPVVDLEAALGWRLPRGMFTDLLHPSPQGAQAIADALAPAVRSALEAPPAQP